MFKAYIIQEIGSGMSPVTLKKWTNRHKGTIKTSVGALYWCINSGGNPHGAYAFETEEIAAGVLAEIVELERHLHKVYIILPVYVFFLPVENRLGWDHPMPKQQ